MFAFDTALSIDTLAEHYRRTIKTLGDHIDVIVILDKAIATLVAKVKGGGGWAPSIFEALSPNAEGSHIGIGVQERGLNTLDAFLRFLWAHLAFFRGIVDHAGFDWSGPGSASQMRLLYLTPVTLEKDPQIRERKLQQYRKEIEEEFSKG